MAKTKLFLICISLTIFVGNVNDASAAPNLLLRCLAKEEEVLHKKSSQTTLFRLNQEFVNELAGSNDINLKKTYVDQICNSRTHSPSVNLLRMLLLKEHEIYDLSFSGVGASMRPFKMGYVNEFQKQVPRMFISYLSGLQSELATPDCLEKAIPELKGFNDKIKYLEEEVSTHQLIGPKNKIETIFRKLENFKTIQKNCAQIKRSRDARLKKKQDSQL